VHDFSDIRRVVIVALFSDDVLFNHLVLKGGNALNLVHGMGTRTSLDVDFSMDEDFSNVDEARERIFRALRDRMESIGLVVFDESFAVEPNQPSVTGRDKWGGYQIEFKVIAKSKNNALSSQPRKRQIDAQVVGPAQQRIFKIQISKWEYCVPKQKTELDEYTIYVYSPALIAIEKLRAICQQMPEYPLRGHRKPRGRDFYDIYTVISETNLDLTTPVYLDIMKQVFAAKAVPHSLLLLIPHQREFHRPDWPSVQDSVSGKLEEFDFYFDFVVDQSRRLEALWDK
jgi:predicted nucleotidyltransferase component of viral defense system